MTKYDAIVVGAGAGGGVAAAVLSEAGKSVLLLERGRDLTDAQIGRDHLRNQRISLYGHNAGPDIDGNPRTSEGGRVIRPHEWGYQNNAACIGSGTRVYAGQAWRFMPQDFRMASIYGVPEGSSLADWPLDYDELAPYYEQVEWQLGVCGDHRGMTHLPDYRRPYPMPALPLPSKSRVFLDALESLGWGGLRMPRLINSAPYNGRPACVYCQHCFGFACPSDAKNGSHNTGIPRAIASGNCTVRSQVMAKKLLMTPGGAVKGVAVIDESGVESDIEARIVVLSCGAVETARLLINSATSREPNGIGNDSDLVGRNLQGHYYPCAFGLFPFDIYGDGIGPGGSVATCDFNHGNGDIIGGGMLADCDIGLPIVVYRRPFPNGIPRWGAAAKQFMRENFRRVSDIMGPVHEIPNPDARVRINPKVKDRYGIPVAHLSGKAHPETVRTAAFMFERAKDWLREAGATTIWGDPPPAYLSGGQHQAGTCRMGDDPDSSVVDRFCRVHSQDNLFVADGSPHVTNGGFNPSQTIMALAWRTAENIAETW